MLKQGTFVNKKFNRLLLGYIWGCLALGITLMTDSLISGNQLGETALEAVTIVFPLFSVVYFLVNLLHQDRQFYSVNILANLKKKKHIKRSAPALFFQFYSESFWHLFSGLQKFPY